MKNQLCLNYCKIYKKTNLFPLRFVAINFLKVKRHFSGNIFLDRLVIVVFLYQNKWTIIPFLPDNHLVAQLPTSPSLNSDFVFFPQKFFDVKNFFQLSFSFNFFKTVFLSTYVNVSGFLKLFPQSFVAKYFFSFSFTAHIRNDDEKVGVVGYPNNDRQVICMICHCGTFPFRLVQLDRTINDQQTPL